MTMQKSSSVTQFELQFYEKIKCLKEYALVFYIQLLNFCDTLQATYITLWQL